jgi:peptidoglycan hydrolase-like protein with peptidoglycan-binding domain
MSDCEQTTLQEGDTGPCVEELQTLLRQRNLLMKEVDGVFDGLTKEAVRDFQGPEGLDTTGVCDPDVWARLFYASGQP